MGAVCTAVRAACKNNLKKIAKKKSKMQILACLKIEKNRFQNTLGIATFLIYLLLILG